MIKRVVLGCNFERANDGESLAMKPIMKNTLEQSTEKVLYFSRLGRTVNA